MDNIPWEVVAPSCPSIDGVTGEFNPIDPTNPGIGTCGYCMTYCVYESTLIVIPGVLRAPFTTCDDSPCSSGELKLVLECNDEVDEGCCEKLRLWVGLNISGGTLVGDNGTVPYDCGVGTATSWVKLAPTTCTCEGGLSAEFSLAGLEIDCDDVYASGPCIGEPTCCRINCDLSDAKIVI